MKRTCFLTSIVGSLLAVAPSLFGGTTNFTWTGALSSSYASAPNWVVDVPAEGTLATRPPSSPTGDDAVIFQGGVTTRTVDLAATARNVRGIQFNNVAGANPFTLNVSGLGSSSSSFGFNLRPDGIVNNDADVQVFNVPLKFFTYAGGTPSSATVFTFYNSLSGGGMTFSGAWSSGIAGKETVNMNGGSLTVDGVNGSTTTIGTTGGGIISGTSGTLTKNGDGALVLGGTAANTYSGGTIINGGSVSANKANALGSGSSLTVNGGTLNIGANNQAVGAVTVAGGTINGTSGTLTGTSYTLQGGTVNAALGGSGVNLTVQSGANTLGGANTYDGTTKITAGSLQLGADNRIADTSNMILDGGTFITAGFSEKVGMLTLTATSIIDFGNGASALSFDSSAAQNWGSFTLSLANWTAGSDSLRFGTDDTALVLDQLSHIVFSDLPGSPTAKIDVNGFVTPVPEPSVLGLCLLGALACAARFAHRRQA